ncbi:MAG TPA: OmpA family protein, partial [Rhizomicrobium sp.]
MRLAVPVLLSALLLSACGGGSRPRADLPLSPPQERPLPPRPSQPARNTAIPPGPAGPLTLARVGDYMDGLESQLRRHLRGILVARQGDNLTVVVPNNALFTADGGVAGDDVLEPLAAILRSYPHTVVQVNGFTDTAGSPERNLALSQKRAWAIAGALAHEGVPGNHLNAQGFGETRLRFATGDDRNEPRNRRIELLIKARPG